METHSNSDENQFEFIDSTTLENLKPQQRILYAESRERLIEFLRTRGKDQERRIGYSESNIRPLARRIHQIHQNFWNQDSIALELTQEHAERFVDDLNQDDFLTAEGAEYTEDSKRKFVQALQAYFRFKNLDWKPSITFSSSEAKLGSDPFRLREREQLLEASFGYRSPPSYKNVSPDERNRWNAYLAQYLGKPKNKISPEDWKELQVSWEIPSLIATALDCGWRAKMVSRLCVKHATPETGQFNIPPKIAVKNDKRWTSEISERSSTMLEKWLSQRQNQERYDGQENIWLNRNGNPHSSATLNTLLRNLMADAEIQPDGRTLTWHSIRHSVGMYVYNQQKDLGLVADVLRHKSLESARRYAHSSPETKTGVIESIQGGV